MGFKSTMDLTRHEAIQIIASKLDIRPTDMIVADTDRLLELILEYVTDYENEESEYYFYNFHVSDGE